MLAAATATLSPELQRVVAYHFGWIDAEGRTVEGHGGKALRPTLVVLSAEAAGATADVALGGAAAVELVHDFTLLHDDVMDEDRERRHRPTAWAVFGVGAAICGGDALMLLAQRLLLQDASPRREAAALELVRATEAVIAGQTLDLAFEGRSDVGIDDYLTMAAGKTGALLGCSASLGALLAGAPAPVVEGLQAYGEALGLAFQAVDDWLGIWGESRRTGKPVASDLRQRKCSLPVVATLEGGGAPAESLRRFLVDPAPPDEAAIADALVRLREAGAEDLTREVARRELARARAALEAAPLAPDARAELHEIASFVVERSF